MSRVRLSMSTTQLGGRCKSSAECRARRVTKRRKLVVAFVLELGWTVTGKHWKGVTSKVARGAGGMPGSPNFRRRLGLYFVLTREQVVEVVVPRRRRRRCWKGRIRWRWRCDASTLRKFHVMILSHRRRDLVLWSTPPMTKLKFVRYFCGIQNQTTTMLVRSLCGSARRSHNSGFKNVITCRFSEVLLVAQPERFSAHLFIHSRMEAVGFLSGIWMLMCHVEAWKYRLRRRLRRRRGGRRTTKTPATTTTTTTMTAAAAVTGDAVTVTARRRRPPVTGTVCSLPILSHLTAPRSQPDVARADFLGPCCEIARQGGVQVSRG